MLIALIVAAILLLTVQNILLVAVLAACWRVIRIDARKRGLLTASDLFHRRKNWYA